MRAVLRRESGIVAATFAALATFVALEVIYERTFGRMVFLTGIPTPGGAPLVIHLFNLGLKGGYAALTYGLVMRLCFGRVAWARVAVLWASGLALVTVLAIADSYELMSPANLFGIGLGLFFLCSLAIVRTWVSR
jgi:hypothetical protein